MEHKPISNHLTVAGFHENTTQDCCSSAAKNVEKAIDELQAGKENVIEAKNDLALAMSDTVQQFKTESKEKIGQVENRIAEINTNITSAKKDFIAEYQKKMKDLEFKNSAIRNKLDDYKEEGKEKLESFRIEFKHDLEGLEHAIKDFTKDSKI